MSDVRERRGFAMITVLWVMAVAAIVAAVGTLAGRNAVNGAINRVHLERARWLATGCIARAHAAIDSALTMTTSYDEAAVVWRVLGRAVLPIEGTMACSVDIEAAGTRLDVNAATPEMLENVFTALGAADARSLTDAIVDWRDSNDVAQPLGAERDWYAAAGRDVPRNGPLADLRELARVRGFENPGAFDAVLTTEPGRVSLATAPVNVLLAVPGFTRETADEIVALERAGTPVADVTSVLGRVSQSSADSLRARFADIARVTTADPDAWVLTVRATVGPPPVTVTLVRRFVRDGKRAVIMDSRSDP